MLVEDVEVKVIQTSREEMQTVNGQQVSYDPKNYTYMIGFNIIIKLNHPYIKSMRIDIKNGTVQIYNVGLRKQDDYIHGFVKDKLGLARVEDKADIKEYAYYLALCDEIRSSLLNK